MNRLSQYFSKYSTGLNRWIKNGEITLSDLQKGKHGANLLNYVINSAADGFFDSDFNGMDMAEVMEMLDIEVSDTDELPECQDYHIILIPDYITAKAYRPYARDWCILESEAAWNEHTKYGSVFYFCINKSMKSERRIVGPNFPYDAYGYSMIAVAVNTLGKIESVTSRWNINDFFLTPEDLRKILGATLEYPEERKQCHNNKSNY